MGHSEKPQGSTSIIKCENNHFPGTFNSKNFIKSIISQKLVSKLANFTVVKFGLFQRGTFLINPPRVGFSRVLIKRNFEGHLS
jgi:hypothetical protein